MAAARSSVGTGVAVALRLRSPLLLDAVHAAYASGVDVMLWVCAAIAIAAADAGSAVPAAAAGRASGATDVGGAGAAARWRRRGVQAAARSQWARGRR